MARYQQNTSALGRLVSQSLGRERRHSLPLTRLTEWLMRSRTPYDARLDFVCPSSLAEAVATAARDEMQSVNSWLRMACIQRLRQQHDETRSGTNIVAGSPPVLRGQVPSSS
jgi:hypothetical protein